MTPILLITVLLVVAALAVVTRGDAATPRTSSIHQPAVPAGLLDRIVKARDRTHKCEALLGLQRTPASGRPFGSPAYARWALTLWKGRAQATCRLARELGYPVAAIRAVFGPYADQALTVAACESGHSRTPRARNGQYLGMFQMGSSERARYGHGDTPLEQARAAHAYFVASGRDWSPWQCQPSGGLAW